MAQVTPRGTFYTSSEFPGRLIGRERCFRLEEEAFANSIEELERRLGTGPGDLESGEDGREIYISYKINR